LQKDTADISVADYPTWGELPDGEFHELEFEDLERMEQCPVCGCADHRVLADVGLPGIDIALSTAVCVECSFVFRNIRPTFEWFEAAWGRRSESAPLFNRQDQAKQRNRKQRYTNTAQLLEEVGSGRSLLDIGSGPGYGLVAFAERGWNVRGVEPDDGRARIGREELGLDIQTRAAETLGSDEAPVDAITIVHVLEHMRDLHAVIAACARALVDRGYLYIEVPDAFSNMNWGDVTHMEHLSYFNEWNLRRAVGQHGFAARYRAFPRTKPWGNRHLGLLFQKTTDTIELAPTSPIDADPYTHYALQIRAGLGGESAIADPIHFLIGGVADSALMVRDRVVVPVGSNRFVVHSNAGGQVLRREPQPMGRRLGRILRALPDIEPLDTAVRTTVNKLAKRPLLRDPGFVRIKYRPV